MKSNIYTIFFFLLFLNIQKVKSQDQDNAKQPYVPNITVAAPQAASISKVGEIPIDISTGRMNYTIPIFEIKEGSFTMPINLSYNYSGLVLDETPGYAGVGWTFNIGGSILHSINGLNDEGHENDKKHIYNYINKLPPFDDYSTPAGLTTISHFLENLANGIFDGEPDKYSVNIGNISCSFYLDKDNNPIFLKNENYKLSGNSTTGFTLTDNQGINYIFNLVQGADKVTENDQYSYNSSFLITEINFPFTSNKILFEYTSSGQYNDINFGQSLIKTTNESGNPNNNFILRNSTTTTILNTLKLSKIITNSCIIDLEYSSNPAEQAIAVIKNLSVKDKSSKSIKSFDFNYSEWVGRRTNLLNVMYNGAITNEMEYDMSLPYPVIESNYERVKKDLWGYYNERATMVNTNGIVDSYNNPKLKPNFESTKIGSLTKITYQTKGYSSIEYEPNIVYMNSSEYNFPYDSDGLINVKPARVSTDPYLSTSRDTLTLKITDVPVELIARYQFTNGFEMAGEHDRHGEINLYENGRKRLTAFKNWYRDLGTWNPPLRTFMNSVSGNIIYVNEPGSYVLEAVSDQGITAQLSVTFKKTADHFNQVVGGIRVKQIKNCDFNGECTTTVYNYEQDGKSTGLMLQRPEFYSGYSIQDNLGCSHGTYVKQQYYNFTSIYPLSNYRGSPVLYKKVEKTDFALNKNDQLVSNGKTIFTYNGTKVSNSLQDEESYFSIGQLDTKLIKDDTGLKVAKQNNSYLNKLKPDVSRFVYAFQCKAIFERRGNASGAGGSSGSGCGLSYPRPMSNFLINQFRHESKNYVLEQEVSTNYYHGDSLVQATTYNYNLNTGFLKSQSTKNSKNEILETKYFYPQDPEMANEPFVDALKLANRIGTPLKTQTFRGETKLSEKKTVYEKSTATSNLLLPKYVLENKGATALNNVIDKKISYDRYDDKGNLLQYTLEGFEPTAIIWGYDKTLPSVKIENTPYGNISSSQIYAVQNASSDDAMELALNNLKYSFSYSIGNAKTTTFMYKPLIGVTRITTPEGLVTYYDYDSFNRLKFVKDSKLNVLEAYCYNYKGQVIDCEFNAKPLYKSVAIPKQNSTSSLVSGEGVTSNPVVFTFTNTTVSKLFTKNDCKNTNTIPETVSYTVEVGTYDSNISQEDADDKAQEDVNTNGQAYANNKGKCISN